MSGTEGLMLSVLIASWMFTLWAVQALYREGWDHGYSAGYDDRDDETIHGEKFGTRMGRTKR